MTSSMSFLYEFVLKGVKKPRDPMWNAITGGQALYKKEKQDIKLWKQLEKNTDSQYNLKLETLNVFKSTKLQNCRKSNAVECILDYI